MGRTRKLVLGSILVVALGVAGAAGGAFWALANLKAPLPAPADGVLFDVSAGASLSKVANDLHSRELVPHPRLLTWYARLRGDATRVQAGEYRITARMTAQTLLEALIAGDVYLRQFTIVEGWRFTDLLTALRAQPTIAATELAPGEIMAALGEPDLDPEGQFLPDTYSFAKGTEDLAVLRLAHAALARTLEKAWASRASNVALASPYEALILASIVEKETALPGERRLISGVFQERLQRGMRLQTDPTVIYGLGDAFDGNLRRRDLDADTPYNTYTRRGLPPTPIALAGAASIEAATDPEFTGALYFVATGEPDGSHRFSATLEEHNRAVADYLRTLRQRDE
jgi:UPF0755 protein